MFVDIHTHKIKPGASVQILNVFAQYLDEKIPDQLFSAGIHPWHLETVNIETCLEALDKACRLKNLAAVGECGLDKLTKTTFARQKNIFERQVFLAEKYNKPLIIHSVKTSNEVLLLKKERRSSIPWILHGFHGNQETTKQLLRHDFYFSVGESLLRNSKLQQVLRQIPVDRLFFESDEREIPIEKIYLFAAKIFETDIDQLIEAIAANFKKLFGNDKLAGEN